MAVISLDGGDWSVREALGDTWRWYVDAPPPVTGNSVADAAQAAIRTPGWLPAVVPGSVITDLVAAGEVVDPTVGRNSRAAEWTGSRSWVYRRSIRLPEFADGESARLELDGLDPSGTVYLDGVEIARVPGLYRRARVMLPGVPPGIHALAIVIDPVPPSEPQVGRTERVRVHRPRMNYGWDFCPPNPHQGIWRNARLVVARQHLGDWAVRAGVEPGGGGWVEAAAGHPCVIEVWRQGRRVATGAGPGRVEMPRVETWWPNGLGEQPLYRVVLRTADDTAECTVGFRTIEWMPAPAAPATALPYRAVVNGTPVTLRGVNWVPADAQYGATRRERVEHLLALAAASGVDLVRVWGGGLVETDEFYETCNRLGLLVWQEFSQSSSGMQSAPATDTAWASLLAEEARAIVPRLAHHPSLALWCGGNELDEGGVPLDEERSPALAALRDVVAELDPGRGFLPTSPSGPRFHNRLDVIAEAPDEQHDVHGPWEHQGLEAHYALYNAGTSLAHTEFGVEGMTNLRSLERLVPEADRWPADRSNAVYRHLGDWWNNAAQVSELFGGIDDLGTLNRASQLLQATGLQYAVEADLRRSPRLSMVLPWQLNESFPNAWCTSLVDYRGDAKPALAALARAYRRTRVTLRVERAVWGGHTVARAEAWVAAAAGVDSGSCLELRLLDSSGGVLAETWLAPGGVGEPVCAGELAADIRAATPVVAWQAVWRDAAGTPLDTEIALATTTRSWAPLLALPTAEVEARVVDGGILVRHTAGPLVPTLRLVDARPYDAPGWAVLAGDPRALLPGEERLLPVAWRGAGDDRRVRLEGFNVAPREFAC